MYNVFTFAIDITEYIKSPFGLVAFRCCSTDDRLAMKSSCVR